MLTQNKQNEKTISESSVKIALNKKGKNLSGKQLERKLTNEAKRQSVKDARDEQRKLSFHYKQLQKFAANYIDLLSKETGKEITVDLVQSLKYSDFLPFLTEREESSNLINGWTFARLLNVVARYYRNEQKKQVIYSPLQDIE